MIKFRTEVMGCGVLNDYWLNVTRNYRELEVKGSFGVGCECWGVVQSLSKSLFTAPVMYSALQNRRGKSPVRITVLEKCTADLSA